MLVGRTILDELKIKGLLADIKKKKELQDISEDFLKDNLFEYLQKNPHLIGKLKSFNPKSAVYRKTVKEVRAKLRKVYGLYREKEKDDNRAKLIENYQHASENKKKQILKQILHCHASTKEREKHYKTFYKKLFRITGKPEKIIDLGSGLNPFSIPLMGLQKLRFYAYDLSNEEINLLKVFFTSLSAENPEFRGKAEVLDITNFSRLQKLKEVDICFLFKMTDVLDKKGHKVSEMVISLVPAKSVVVSFPTSTMSGKNMNFPRRRWIELMCSRLGYGYEVIELPNELFYVIKKQ